MIARSLTTDEKGFSMPPIQEVPPVTFEQNPILLVVFVVATIEGWTLAKAAVRSLLERRRKTAAARR